VEYNIKSDGKNVSPKDNKMKIENIVKSKINIASKHKITSQLGYSSDKKALTALDKFLKSKDLHTWLHSGYFDFKYTATDLFKKLCEILEIDNKIVDKALFEDKRYQVELERFRYSYIFVYTNFKRKCEPIHVLAVLESQRRLRVPRENLLFKTEEEVLNVVKDFIIKQHFESKGDVGVWGKAINYIFHHNNNKYVFDTNGNRVFDINLTESKAILKI